MRTRLKSSRALVAIVGSGLLLGTLTSPASAHPAIAPVATSLSAAAPISAAAPAPPVSGLTPRPIADGKQHTVTYDQYSLMIDGQRLNLWSSEFHYWRLPSPSLWRDVLQKLKANGYNAVSIYFDWDYHSPKNGVYDFSGIRNIDQLLDIAQQTGIYVIARPGPYINAETDSGGLPGWLSTIKGRERTTDADYLAAADQWYHAIDPILARHQITNGTGPIILYQVENEWMNDLPYFKNLIDTARADGITVPTFHNDGGIRGAGQQGDGGPDLYAFDSYPQSFDCSHPDVWPNQPLDITPARQYSPTGPLFVAEFQGGAFDPWGGPGYASCARLTNSAFERVFYESNLAYGATAQNFYMGFGGTSWGWLPAPDQVYTSYDYGSPITEGRQLTDKSATMKELGFLVNTVKPLAKTDTEPNLSTSNTLVQVQDRKNPDTGTHLLVARQADATSTADESSTFALSTADGTYPRVPQSGALRLNGRDSKLLVADWDFAAKQHLVYSTSEVFSDAIVEGHPALILDGRPGQDGETVLRYPSKPTVTVNSGSATTSWDAAKGDLRLDYVHNGTTQVTITGGGLPDQVLRFSDDTALVNTWKQDTAAGPVLEDGPELVRTAAVEGGALSLTGDTKKAVTTTVWAPASVTAITWNGASVQARKAADGSWKFTAGGPKLPVLPKLTHWKTKNESAIQAAPSYDDSAWTVADKQATNNPTPPTLDQPLLYADEYGFHHGDVWYRGHFTATGKETSIDLGARTGGTVVAQKPTGSGLWSAWLNGTFLGSSTDTGASFPVPVGALREGKDNVIAVLVRDMGHNETFANGDFKGPRGLTSATLSGSPAQIVWRLQGSLGGEDLPDPTRGVINNGGLLGEREGWSLPGYPASGWTPTTLPAAQPAGLTWYRTTFSYQPINGQDTSVALRISDDAARQYRALLFVNGWNLGQYINNLGPQHDFVIPNGILHSGVNTIAIPSWAADGSGGLGKVSLISLGTLKGGVRTADVASPAYRAATYRTPATLGRVSVTSPGNVTAGQTFPVSATFTAQSAKASGTTLHLSTTEGWKVTGVADVPEGTVAAGAKVTATWQVTAPADAAIRLGFANVSATATQRGKPTTARGSAESLIPLPIPTGTPWVSSLVLQSTNGLGPIELDHSNGQAAAGDGKAISIGGTTFAHGLGTYAPSSVKVFLGGNCTRFTATVGVDDEVGDNGGVQFSVVADGKNLITTDQLNGADPAGAKIDLDVTGANRIELDTAISPWYGGSANDSASWGDAKLVCHS